MNSVLESNIFSISDFVKNNSYNFKKDQILEFLPDEYIEEALKTICSWKTYEPTPLVELNKLSNHLNIDKIYYKDEGFRFHLKSFKALGGAFAVDKIVKETKTNTVATATAGNHGRSVAWGARRLGINCKIFISEFVSEERASAMRSLGAEVIRVKGNYDASLKECLKKSQENNWEIVQDVSWENYMDVPKYIMAGYSVMIKEIIDELNDQKITHVFLQAGVGGMAAAAIAGFAKFSKNVPSFIIVEPKDAECVLESIKNSKPTSIDIKKESIMGGMSCGDVSTVAWEILKNSANYCLSISDEGISSTVALLSNKDLSKNKIVAGECGVPGIISLISLMKDQEKVKEVGINENSKVLLIGCEGLTDQKMYDQLLSSGLEKIKNV